MTTWWFFSKVKAKAKVILLLDFIYRSKSKLVLTPLGFGRGCFFQKWYLFDAGYTTVKAKAKVKVKAKAKVKVKAKAKVILLLDFIYRSKSKLALTPLGYDSVVT